MTSPTAVRRGGGATGAGISTAGDVATYVEALIGGGLLSSELQALRLDSLQPVDADDPQSPQYGLALAQLEQLLATTVPCPGSSR